MEPARARAKSKRRNSDRASVRIGGKPAAPCNARRNSARFRIRGRRVHRRERWGPGVAAKEAVPEEELAAGKSEGLVHGASNLILDLVGERNEPNIGGGVTRAPSEPRHLRDLMRGNRCGARV